MPTAVFPTIWALRMRVSISAMGSVMLISGSLLLPARLDQSRDLSAHRDFAQLVAPQSELAKDPARPAGQPATIAQAHGRCVPRQLLELLARLLAVLVGALGVVDDGEDRSASGGELGHRLAALLFAVDEGELGHDNPSSLEWKAEGREQRARFVVGLRRGGDADIEPPQGVDLVVFDLREDDLFLDAEVVVAAAVECSVRNAAEVADARNSDRYEAVKEFVHARAAQGYHAADRKILPDLENGDRLLRFRDHGLLAGDLAEVCDGVVQDLLVRRRLADAHVERDLPDARHLHRGLVPELLHQVGHDVLAVIVLKAGHSEVLRNPYGGFTKSLRIRRPPFRRWT